MLVVVSHLGSSLDFRFPRVIDVFRESGDLGVGLFFLISGVVVPWSLAGRTYHLRHFPRFIARRLIRLDPPYFATITIAFVLIGRRALRDGTPLPFTMSDLVMHLGYLCDLTGHRWVLSVFWTLGIEFQFYLLIGLAFPLLAIPLAWGRAPREWFLLLTALTWGIAHAPALYFTGSWGYWSHYFLLGFAVFLVRRGYAHWSLPIWEAGLVWYLFAPIDPVMWGVLIAGGGTIVVVPADVSRWRGWLLPLFGLGAISYSLYLTHLLLLGKITGTAIARGWTNSTAGALVVAGVEIAFSLCVATALWASVERPFLSLSRRVRV